MFRGDLDVLDEVLKNNCQFFDAVYALDGSCWGKPKQIIEKHKNIVFYVRDVHLPPEYKPIRDGARQFLLQKIQKDHPDGGWITLLHSDEIFLDVNPRDVAEESAKEGFGVVGWRLVNFFLHISEKNTYKYDESKSVVDQVTWACFPGWVELRQFRYDSRTKYNIRNHFCTIPTNCGETRLTSYPLRHYLYRSPEQMRNNAEDRINRGWQTYGKWMNDSPVFVDCLPCYTRAVKVGRRKILNGDSGVLND